jgi:hypothetical protein
MTVHKTSSLNTRGCIEQGLISYREMVMYDYRQQGLYVCVFICNVCIIVCTYSYMYARMYVLCTYVCTCVLCIGIYIYLRTYVYM